MQKFEFSVQEGEELTPKSAIMQAVGAASMTWGKPARGRVFDSESAEDIGETLYAFLLAWKSGKSVAERVQDLVLTYEGRIKNQVGIINRMLEERTELIEMNKKLQKQLEEANFDNEETKA